MVSLGFGPDGKQLRKKVSGTSKSQVRAKLGELHDDLNDGVVTQADYTVQKAIKEWLEDGLPGRSAKTVSTYREVLAPLSEIIGNIPLLVLTAVHVRSVLSDNGMAIEEISRLVGHSSTNVTETVYRNQLRPVITTGAEVMDKLFSGSEQ